jgi:uncharacterized membrane protein YeaQ/YmgE (transglycosylase-associated protein family)
MALLDQSTSRENVTMGIVYTIIVGFIVGLLARAIMPGEQKLGIILTTVLGVAGSLIAGYLGQLLGLYQAGQGAGFIGSIVGALILLFAYALIKGRRS